MRIKKVPADATRQQLVLLMEQVTGERVVDVVIASDSNSSTSLLVRRGKLLGRRERHYQHVQLLRSKVRSQLCRSGLVARLRTHACPP